MTDDNVLVAELRAAVDAFVAAPDWRQFHNAKDLAISICIESAELLEEFQWLTAEQVSKATADPEARERIRFELADVLVYCLCLSNALDLDVSDAVLVKLGLAGQKYPEAAYKGQARKPGRPA